MKKLFNMGIIFALTMQSTNVFSAEIQQQGLGKRFANWFWSKLSRSEPTTIQEAELEQRIRETTPRAKAGVYAGYPPVAAVMGIGIGLIEYGRDFKSIFSLGTSAFFLGGIVGIHQALEDYATEKNRPLAVQKVKEALRAIVINNSLLYPTRSSKLHVLLRRDEFLEFIHDYSGIVEIACNELIAEMNPKASTLSEQDQLRVYQEEVQKIKEEEEKDKETNNYIAKLKSQIFHLSSLEEQIKFLENLQKESEDLLTLRVSAGYYSLLYRLKNKLAVEEKLSLMSKEKSERDPWRMGEKVLVSSEAFKPVHEKHLESMKSINELTKQIIEARKPLLEKQKEWDRIKPSGAGERQAFYETEQQSFNPKQKEIWTTLENLKKKVQLIEEQRDKLIKEKQEKRIVAKGGELSLLKEKLQENEKRWEELSKVVTERQRRTAEELEVMANIENLKKKILEIEQKTVRRNFEEAVKRIQEKEGQEALQDVD